VLGPVEQCIARIQEYVDAGARHIVFSVSGPREGCTRQIETIAKEIIPHFQRSPE
jgi:alkanesulfonate monooxygenase SsuD/methylene tetrahydromethanopterin reductase-like flavin-dependent oxidoreductase (luciferase family)